MQESGATNRESVSLFSTLALFRGRSQLGANFINAFIGNKHFKFYQFKEALLDPLTWAFVFYALVADIPNGGLSNFFSQLIVSFGYTPEQSLLYGTPGGAVEVVALIFSGWLGDRLGRRLLVSLGGMSLALLGMILIVALPLGNNSGRLAGYYLTQASPTPFVALLSLISTNVAGYTKKSTVAAMYLIAYCKSFSVHSTSSAPPSQSDSLPHSLHPPHLISRFSTLR